MSMDLDEKTDNEMVADKTESSSSSSSSSPVTLTLGEDETWIVEGHLKKKILTPATAPNAAQPPKGSEVQVHYVGKLLNGVEFDSSRKRNQPFSFKLGKGNVIKGWDEGVPTMRIGEKSLLTISPDYGYGAAGSPPSIPPNSILTFEVELISFDAYENVTTDGGVRKRIITASTGYTKPNDGATVTVKLSLARKDSPSHLLIDRKENPITFALGEDMNVFDGIEEAVKSMYSGERSEFALTAKYGFASTGFDSNSPVPAVLAPLSASFPRPTQSIPPNSQLIADIELVKVDKTKEVWQMNEQEKQQAAIKQKEIGNALFKLGRIFRAKSKYEAALKLITPVSSADKEKKPTPEVAAIRLPLLTNLALVAGKEGDNAAVIKHGDEALALQPDNVKALVRVAGAYAAMDEPVRAEERFVKALELESAKPTPDSAMITQIKKERAKLRVKLNAAKEKERKMFGGWFNKVKLVDEAEEKQREEEKKKKASEDKFDDSDDDELPHADEAKHTSADENANKSENTSSSTEGASGNAEQEMKDEEAENGTPSASTEAREKRTGSGINEMGNRQGEEEASG